MYLAQSLATTLIILLQRETPNSILSKSVQFRVQTWLRQIDKTSIVVDSLAVMVLYSVQVRATYFSSLP